MEGEGEDVADVFPAALVELQRGPGEEMARPEEGVGHESAVDSGEEPLCGRPGYRALLVLGQIGPGLLAELTPCCPTVGGRHRAASFAPGDGFEAAEVRELAEVVSDVGDVRAVAEVEVGVSA